ncbi:hypothetical protein GEV33_004179 [Tenebrio molitor]|uniref:Regulatory protein zeste n=1 Tax=Tenebrio molitor TaxID=7067 RepID=A0A8J6HQA0_TENMO|nr:hypothetical protein GEV33_004179 [Tenebrio molitor]
MEKYRNTWATLAENLNSLGGSKKNVKEWKASLGTLKEVTRKKARVLKQEIQGTGGGPPKQKDLNPSEERLLSLLSPVVISGLDTLPEAGVPKVSIETTEFLDITGEYMVEQPSEVAVEVTPTNPSTFKTKSNLKRKKEDSTIIELAKKHEEILKVLAESNVKLAQSNLTLAKANRLQCLI